jgi:hypothetical protein
MRLKTIHSRELLPRFADQSEWLQNGFDVCVRQGAYRIGALDAPMTLDSIAKLTDDELKAYYAQYNVAEYYQDLSRSTRDKMLYWTSRLYRYLGTPRAIEILCEYVFDGNPLRAIVHDNLAFDENGYVIDPDLFDVFDVEVVPENNYLPDYATARIKDNIINVSRNSQALRNLYYTMPDNELEITVYMVSEYDGKDVVIYIENDVICDDASPFINIEIPIFEGFRKILQFDSVEQTIDDIAKVCIFDEISTPYIGYFNGSTIEI